MAALKSVPEIRFTGFSEPWEVRKLGEFVDVTTGKLDANAMVEDGDYDFYTSGIKKYRIDIPAFEGPAITIAGNGATVGYMHLADGKFNAYQRTYVLTHFRSDRQFLFAEISNKLPRKISEEARTGNIPYIVMDMINKLDIKIPIDSNEQKCVGAVFANLDHLLALHKRELTKLQNMRRAMLEKMFPKDGENIPEIRFAGFSDGWEQAEVGEILAEKISNGIMNQPGRNNLNIKHINVVNLYTPSYIHLDELEYINVTRNDLNRCNVEVDDIFLTRSSLKVDGIAQANILLNEGTLVFDDHIMRLKLTEKFEPFFIKESLNYSPVKKQFMAKSKTGTMTTIGQEDITSSTITFPSKPEQSAIGDFFLTLDHLLALHKRELTKLQNIKRALLEKMFI